MMQRVPLSQLWLLKLNEGEAAEEALRYSRGLGAQG